jgi:hypothetical protein
VLLDASAPENLGDHPWNTLPPFILDTSAALQLGFTPVGSYAETVAAEIDWLADAGRTGDPATLPSPADPYFRPFFGYAEEDTWLEQTSHRTGT